MFRLLRVADDRLQVAFRGLLRRYFQFLHAVPRGLFQSTRWLRMRTELDQDGRIRRIAWTIRIKATRSDGGRVKRLTRRLRGKFRRDWVYSIAKDWRRVADYESFEKERLTLNAFASQMRNCRMRLRLAFENGWASRTTAEDLRRRDQLHGEASAFLAGRDALPLLGIVAFDREARFLEAELGGLVDDYRRRFERSFSVRFEPALRPTKGGTLRLYWGFPQRVGTSEGTRTFTDYLHGRPTDRLMRKLRIPVWERRRVGAFLRRLLPVERRYRAMVGLFGSHRRRVYELMARMAKHEGFVGLSGDSSGRRGRERSTPGRHRERDAEEVFGERWCKGGRNADETHASRPGPVAGEWPVVSGSRPLGPGPRA